MNKNIINAAFIAFIAFVNGNVQSAVDDNVHFSDSGSSYTGPAVVGSSGILSINYTPYSGVVNVADTTQMISCTIIDFFVVKDNEILLLG